MITQEQVLKYLDKLSTKDLENVFSNYIEYTSNTDLENEICMYQIRVEELEEELECIRDNGMYE